MQERRDSEFLVFASEQLLVGGRCHESEIVGAFRAYYPRYRRRDMSSTVDGESVPDNEICALVRTWNAKMGRPGERTPTGFWKGVSLKKAES